MLESVRMLSNQDINFYATHGTAKFLRDNNVPNTELNWPLDNEDPNVIDYIKDGKIDLVINIPKNYQKDELTNGYYIRRAAVDYNVMLISNRQIAMRLIEAMAHTPLDKLHVKSWDEYH